MKKGSIALSELLLAILAVIVLSILIVTIFTGPQSFLENIKKILPRADTYINKPLTGEQQTSHQLTLDEANKQFSDLMNTISQLQTAIKENTLTTACVAEIENPTYYESLFKEYHITITYTGTKTVFYLDPDIKEGEEQTSGDFIASLAHQEFDDIKPCLVMGSQAQTFYTQWLDTKGKITPEKPAPDYVFQKQILLDKETLQDQTGTGQQWRTREKGNYLIYLHDNHLCFFPTRSDWFEIGNDCILLTEDGSTFIDDDCFTPQEDGAWSMLKQKNAFLLNKATGTCTN